MNRWRSGEGLSPAEPEKRNAHAAVGKPPPSGRTILPGSPAPYFTVKGKGTVTGLPPNSGKVSPWMTLLMQLAT